MTAIQSDMGAVVIHFHREADVAKVVASLSGQGVDPDHIILVDNGSDKRVLERELARYGSSPTVVDLPNPGYAAALNRGIRELPRSISKVVVLTHEVVLESGCLPILSRTLEDEQGVGLVGPLLVIGSGPAVIWSAGGITTRWLHLPTHLCHRMSLESAPRRTQEVEWVDGAVFMVWRKAWESIGGADERYFLYMEDLDLGWRIRRAGLRVLMNPSAKAQQSPGGAIPQFLVTRNMILFLLEHKKRLSLLLWFLGSSGAAAIDWTRRRPTARPRWLGLAAGLRRIGGEPPGDRALQ